MAIRKQESYPLAWPTDWPRTRPQDQQAMASWKRTAIQYRKMLLTELQRMKSPSAVISCNIPETVRDDYRPGVEPRDVGVAVYFSLAIKQDFAWQDALQIKTPYPTKDEVNDAFKRLSRQYHPDAGGDVTMFTAYVRHRDNAFAFIDRRDGNLFDHIICCDKFKEVRLNICAITQTIRAIRQIERCGTSAMLERAFKGFAALPETASPASVGVGSER